ncbi:ERF family protein [Robbsia andropogonis]|uniref:ERF family protein n=1 Tax=Robbsia andropogonis TaxID=28092 RepID=UPI0020A0CB0E|nr:ERF family protein [Robbsia andropogonis]MCP1117013.1 ERF family protein [Robbsia andropogonis]MCP1126308.1 ERF family protein [Robbsia andropogonis]
MSEIIEHEQSSGRGLPVQTAATPADLFRLALEKDASLETLERMMTMQIQWQAHEAKKAYTEAMAEFKKNPPVIIKDKHVSFKTEKGTTSYTHATIGNVVEKIVAALADHGFSHRWVTGRSQGGMISITCVITHKLGHSEETTLEAPMDQSGGKNNIQAMISTKTYLERHTLLAAVGLATKDQEDDDGAAAGTNDADIALREKWIAYARNAPNIKDLDVVWKNGQKAINAAGSTDVYNAFKAEVQYLTKRFKGEAS